jgi:RNA polymerase sigma-70 factor, ECF subfamily
MRDLVEQARHGDHEAFTSLVAMTADRMYATAYLIMRDRVRAEDAVQDAFLRAWRDLPRLRDADRFESWLRRILVNACYDALRRQPLTIRADAQLHREPSVEDETAVVAHRDALERAFARLTAEQRAIVVLTHVDDLSNRDAAEALGIPVGTVKSRLHHALRALRAAMDADSRPPQRSERGPT